jgi:mannosyltransferase
MTPSAPRRQQAVVFAALVVLLHVGLGLRLVALGEMSVTYDESYSWKMATFPYSEQWARAAADNHPPLFYYLLKAWSDVWGRSPYSLSWLSVLTGLLSIAGAFAVVVEIEKAVYRSSTSDPRVYWPALLAAGLLAVSPFQTEWSQTIRMYAPGATLTLWSTWALVRALYAEHPRAIDWPLYAMLATALIYTHYFGFFVLAAHALVAVPRGIAGWLRPDGRGLSRWKAVVVPALAAVAVVVLWWPWMDEFLEQRRRGIELDWGRPTGFAQVVAAASELFGWPWSAVDNRSWVPVAVAAGFAVASVLMLVFGRGPERVCGLGVVCSFGLAVAIGSGEKSLVMSWYFLFAHALFLCGLAILVCRIGGSRTRGAVCGILFLAAAWQGWVQMDWRRERARLPGLQGAIAYVESQRSAEEPIYADGHPAFVLASPYIERPGTLFILPSKRPERFELGMAVVDAKDYATREDVSRVAANRVWTVVLANSPDSGPKVDMPSDWIDVAEEAFPDWRHRSYFAVVRRYERREALLEHRSRQRGIVPKQQDER